MNTANYTDLLPYFCGSSKLDAIKTASTLNRTSKSLCASTSKDSFWENLLKQIGEKTGAKDKNYALVKHRFYVLTNWIHNTPILTHELVNARSFVNHPCSFNSQLYLVSIATKMYIYAPLNYQKQQLPFDGSSIFTEDGKKFYSCAAYSEDYLIINKDDSIVYIYKNKKLLSAFDFNGLIFQLEIQHDHLFIRGTNQNDHVLSILDLNDLTIAPKVIAVPFPLDRSVIIKAYFGESHVGITCINDINTSFKAASYKDLLNEPSHKSPWIELCLTGKFRLFEKNDRFISVKFIKNRAFDIGEIICSNGHLDYRLIEPGITVLQSSAGFYFNMDCIQERIFIAYNDQETNYVCTYDIQSKKMAQYKLTDGPGFATAVALPTFIATTPLKVYYLTYPYMNGEYNTQKISIFGLDYESQSQSSQENSERPK